MSIDWITVAAQILNFLVLVYLLKRFLYRPVIAAMDRREHRIADRLQQAQARENEAQQEIAACEAQQRDFADQRAQRMKALDEEMHQHRQQLLQDAHQEIAEQRAHWQAALERELTETSSRLRQEATRALTDIARRALGDLATMTLEEAMVARLLQHLEAVEINSVPGTADSTTDRDAVSAASKHATDPTSQTASVASLIKALASGEAPVRVLSSEPLDPSLREQITQTLSRLARHPVAPTFAQAPNLLCGLAIECGGWRLDWSLDEYMTEIDERLQQALQKHALQQASQLTQQQTPEKSEDTGEARAR